MPASHSALLADMPPARAPCSPTHLGLQLGGTLLQALLLAAELLQLLLQL